MKEIKGICPIIATAFTENGEVDYVSLEKEIEHLIKGGCHAVTLFGIAGEYYKLTDEERFKMAELTIATCRRLGGTSILSVTDHATEIAAVRAKQFADMGADCLMMLPPFFLKPGAGWLYDHMKAIANAAPNTPIMAQYAPEQTGVAIGPDVFKKLGEECPNIIYYKIECKPAGPYITKLLQIANPETTKIFVGNAGFQLIEAMDRGAIGAMPGCSMYDAYLDIYNHYVDGDRAGAIDLHNKILPMLNHIRQNVEQIISFEKRILKRRGIIASDYCRKPSYDTDPYFDKLFDEFYAEMSARYGW